MRITLVIYSLNAGGAERVMSTMANFWAEKKWTVNLLTLDSPDAPPFYKLHPAVRHRALGLASVSKNPLAAMARNLHRVRLLRRAIRETEPDVVLSSMSQTNVLTLFATGGMKVPVIVREANNPYLSAIGKQWILLRRWTYRKAARVVLLSRDSLPYFSDAVQRRAMVIPNPVMIAAQPRSANSSNGEMKTIIAMGRFVPQKGFEMLLQAFARIAEKHPAWSLEILGDGPLRAELESLAEKLGVAARVRMPGVTKEPWDKLRQADLFVMSSRFEGFPNALCEAMACGLPAISFDCRTGPAEIIRNGVDGVLVPAENVGALGDAMERLMNDPKQREALAARAPEVLERFGLQKVMGIWEAAIAELTGSEKPERKQTAR